MTQELSRSEKMIAEKTVCMLLVRGENPDGGPIFAYVAVRADKLEEFMQAQESGLFYPDEYGVIVESGDGEPSDEVRKRMEDEYGFNHQAMMDIPTSITQEEIDKNVHKLQAESHMDDDASNNA